MTNSLEETRGQHWTVATARLKLFEKIRFKGEQYGYTQEQAEMLAKFDVFVQLVDEGYITEFDSTLNYQKMFLSINHEFDSPGYKTVLVTNFQKACYKKDHLVYTNYTQKFVSRNMVATKLTVVLTRTGKRYNKIVHTLNKYEGFQEALYQLLTTTDLAQKSTLFDQATIKSIADGNKAKKEAEIQPLGNPHICSK